ncbi:hypothetical protein J4729_03615 [Leisingera sp. HS039]|uniref:hypothetical protein n=1 Tax=unclassified Leisingera TaxID=2614906 RepID=UPI0010714A9B|nr:MULTISPECIES: hypothetical protein [unclassified Leisingera]MBQ4823640.1 hypothetical protein [Leisingera sp. HS039]QBR37243.1 hypothetical protein ETW23_15025 [Leisingera sp. NJS201]
MDGFLQPLRLSTTPASSHLAASPTIHDLQSLRLRGYGPQNREVIIIGETLLTEARLAELAALPQTGFLVPEPSTFISTVRLGMSKIDLLRHEWI